MTTLLYPATEPLAAQAPMPHRKLIRAWLTPICERSTVYALWLVLFDLVLFAAGLVITVQASHPALQVLAGLATERRLFDSFSSLRAHLELAYWEEAVALLEPADHAHLRELVARAWNKLNQPRIQIPFQEHRELHLTIYRRLDNPFVVGLLEAYWDAYEAVELNTYADYGYLQEVWRYHEHIVEAICQGRPAEGKQLLIEHMQLLSARGASIEMPVHTNGVAAPANLSM